MTEEGRVAEVVKGAARSCLLLRQISLLTVLATQRTVFLSLSDVHLLVYNYMCICYFRSLL